MAGVPPRQGFVPRSRRSKGGIHLLHCQIKFPVLVAHEIEARPASSEAVHVEEKGQK